MPEILYTAPDISSLIEAGIKARGLPEKPPAAVVHITEVLGSASEVFAELLSDLPAELRAFEWLEVVLSAYAEFSSRAITVDG